MQPVTRRAVLGTAAALPLSAPFINHALAAEFTFKVAHGLFPDHPTNIRLNEAAANVAKETNGRMELRIFPANQLGGESDMLNQVRSGAIETFLIGGLVISSVVPMAALDGTGFAFNNFGQVWKAMDGELGAFIRTAMMAQSNIYFPRTIWDLGFRQITNSVRPVNSVADIAGMKLRVPGAAAYVDLFKALGAEVSVRGNHLDERLDQLSALVRSLEQANSSRLDHQELQLYLSLVYLLQYTR